MKIISKMSLLKCYFFNDKYILYKQKEKSHARVQPNIEIIVKEVFKSSDNKIKESFPQKKKSKN